eukprot:tig00000057_g114.t1
MSLQGFESLRNLLGRSWSSAGPDAAARASGARAGGKRPRKKQRLDLDSGGLNALPSPVKERFSLIQHDDVADDAAAEGGDEDAEDAEAGDGAGEEADGAGDTGAVTTPRKRLPPTYYLTNFWIIVDTVLERDGHLFLEEERAQIELLRSLSERARRLFVRIYNRKGPWLRIAWLSYAEIDDVEAAAEELVASGLLARQFSPAEGYAVKAGPLALALALAPAAPAAAAAAAALAPAAARVNVVPEDLLSALRVGELREALSRAGAGGGGGGSGPRASGSNPGGRASSSSSSSSSASAQALASASAPNPAQVKRGLLADLKKAWARQGTLGLGRNATADPVLRALASMTGPVVRVHPSFAEILGRVRRLFFMNESQDASSLVLQSKGRVVYATYVVRRDTSVFGSRADLLEYEEALRAAGRFEAAVTEVEAGGEDSTALVLAEEAVRVLAGRAAPAAPALEGARAAPALEGGVSAVGVVEILDTDSEGEGEGERGGGRGSSAGPGPPPPPPSDPPPAPSGALVPSEGERTTRRGLRLPLGHWAGRFTAGCVAAHVLTVAVSLRERRREYREAVAALRRLLEGPYAPGRRGRWWLRLAVDLDHLGRKEESLQACEGGLDDVWTRSGERVALARKLVRLWRRPLRWRSVPPRFAAIAAVRNPREVRVRGRPLEQAGGTAVGARSRFWGWDDSIVSVEELALQHYASEAGGAWRGEHCESGVFLTLFGLLAWDVLFADVPNVFASPFQDAPLDLTSDSFYPARYELILRMLEEVRTGDLSAMLEASWSSQRGVRCRGVNWDRHTLEQLQEMATCIGGTVLSGIFRVLCEDYAHWCSGMPDLLLWRTPSTPGERGRAKLVEVKGPNDRLSDRQRAWIDHLLAEGADVELCLVGPDAPEAEEGVQRAAARAALPAPLRPSASSPPEVLDEEAIERLYRAQSAASADAAKSWWASVVTAHSRASAGSEEGGTESSKGRGTANSKARRRSGSPGTSPKGAAAGDGAGAGPGAPAAPSAPVCIVLDG